MKAQGAGVVLPPNETHLNPDGTVGEAWVRELRAAAKAYAREKRDTHFPQIQVCYTDGGRVDFDGTSGLTYFFVGDNTYGAAFRDGDWRSDALPMFTADVKGERREPSFSFQRFEAFLEKHRLSSWGQRWLAVVLSHFGCEAELADLRQLIQASRR